MIVLASEWDVLHEWAFNFDPVATLNDGSCYPFIEGCTDNTA